VFKYPAIFGNGSVAAILDLFFQLATLNCKELSEVEAYPIVCRLADIYPSSHEVQCMNADQKALLWKWEVLMMTG